MIELTRLHELKPGLIWARCRINPHEKHALPKWSHWMVVEILGVFPFLRSQVVFDPSTSENYVGRQANDPAIWQFGPDLEIPSVNYVEVLPANEIKR